MTCTFTIHPDRGLVVIRYGGHVTVAEGVAAFGEYLRHPDRAPGQRQLIDLSEVDSFQTDFAELLSFQARKAAAFYDPESPTLIAYCAPGAHTVHMARLIQRSWEGLDGVVVRVLRSEAEALSFLGLPEERIAAL